jgi:hypothetical protein
MAFIRTVSYVTYTPAQPRPISPKPHPQTRRIRAYKAGKQYNTAQLNTRSLDSHNALEAVRLRHLAFCGLIKGRTALVPAVIIPSRRIYLTPFLHSPQLPPRLFNPVISVNKKAKSGVIVILSVLPGQTFRIQKLHACNTRHFCSSKHQQLKVRVDPLAIIVLL